MLAKFFVVGCGVAEPATAADYDPLAAALRAGDSLTNLESGVPPMCYTATDGQSNPCWVCHTGPTAPNERNDAELQREYAFSEAARINHWTNLFVDRRAAASAISDEAILNYIREDNLAPLRAALDAERLTQYPGYRPDLDFERGFDAEGFARDGSGWRAVRYAPFPGTFWPTNGSSDDVFIRLPERFRRTAEGARSTAIYRINLSIVEAAIAADPDAPTDSLVRTVEPLDETIAGIDLDGDGQRTVVRRLRGLPSHYVGGASAVPVVRAQHPEGTEYLHSVRYVDPDAPDLRSRRIKELRYARHVVALDAYGIQSAYDAEAEERLRGRVPVHRGDPTTGLLNAFGWQFQGFIEAADGRLRLQTLEEHRFCMGCHGGLGVTVDSTFALARKVPGEAGWRVQDLRGMHDAPQSGHDAPEVLTYFRRVGGADELRANDEMLARFWPAGVLDEAAVHRAGADGDRDLAWLLTPSRARALDLARAYRLLVREQSFVRGRDPTLRPAVNVHRRIVNGDTALARSGRTYDDGRLVIAWDRE